jgi:lipoprotein NlpI/transglutaminase-like putative cysteine protease
VTLALCLAVSCAQAEPQRHTQGGFEFFVDSVPGWVQRTTVPPLAAPTAGQGAVRLRLWDGQVVLDGAAPQRYLRTVTQAAAPAGLEAVARANIAFNPRFETLTVHAISVLRGSKRIDRLSTARVDLMRRETELEAGVFDGMVTAAFTIDDVRVGDSVEVEYSVRGSNPVLGGRYNRILPLAFELPVDLLQVRVLAVAGRTVAVRSVPAADAVRSARQGRYNEWRVRMEKVPALPQQDDAPDGLVQLPRLEISEYRNWGEVAQWADALYRVPEDLSPQVREMVAELKGAGGDRKDALRRALKFVQDEIRYVGIEIGQGSVQPSHPNEVLRRRYGDCKDKTLLLIALARALGVEAYPALVSTWAGRRASELLAMPVVFDHMIVHARVDGGTYWLDPTRSHQEGRIERIGAVPFQWALVAGVGADRLSEVVPAPGYQEAIDVLQEFAVSDYRTPAAMRRTVSFSGAIAEAIRAVRAEEGDEDLAADLLAEVQAQYPQAAASDSLQVEDDAEENVVRFTQRYSVPDFLRGEGRNLRASLFATFIHELTEPKVPLERSAPLATPYPLSVTTTHVVDFPDDIAWRPGPPLGIRDDNVEFSVGSTYENRRLQVHYRLNMRRSEVPAGDVSAYARTLQDIHSRLAYRVPVRDGAQLARPRALQAAALRPAGDNAEDVAASLDREQEAKARVDTEDIESGRLQGHALAGAYLSRAIHYSNLDRLQEALDDLGRAVELDPAFSGAYLTRGQVYEKLQRYTEALADFTTVQRLDPDSGSLLRSRGRVQFLRGDYRAAQADFRALVARTEGTDRLHAAIWLYLATRRSGEDGGAAVSALPASGDLSEWPGPALMLYLGEVTPQQMLAAAWSFDPKTEVLNLCEAWFFLGEHYLLEGEPERAREAFERSVATGIKHYLEYSVSRIELERLAGKGDSAERAAGR